MSNNMFERLT